MEDPKLVEFLVASLAGKKLYIVSRGHQGSPSTVTHMYPEIHDPAAQIYVTEQLAKGKLTRQAMHIKKPEGAHHNTGWVSSSHFSQGLNHSLLHHVNGGNALTQND